MIGRRLRLEFAPRARTVSPAGLALAALGVIVLVLAGLRFADAWQDRARARGDLAQLETRRDGGAAAQPRAAKADPAQLAQTRAAHEAADHLMTPWGSLFESLGAAASPTVALLAVEPSAARHTVRLTAEARDLRAMLDYVGTLQRDPGLASVALVSHQLQVQAPGTPVRFQVQAEWGDAR